MSYRRRRERYYERTHTYTEREREICAHGRESQTDRFGEGCIRTRMRARTCHRRARSRYPKRQTAYLRVCARASVCVYAFASDVLSNEREAIGVHARRWNSQEYIAATYIATIDDLVLLHNSHREATEVVFSLVVEVRHLSRLCARTQYISWWAHGECHSSRMSKASSLHRKNQTHREQ